MEEIKQALHLKAELDKLRPIDKVQEARIMQKFRLDWNYHSNHLEGNTLTYGETKALILHGITAQGKTLKDHFEITGHNEAINWVIEMISGERPLTENFIRELHTLLLKEPYEVDAITPDGKPTKKLIAVGSYKTTANHVKTKTGEIFYFATPEETPAEMNDLLVWYNEKRKETNKNPIFIAAQFHYKFIRIHPFDDGNGRTARILMNFILMQFGFPPTIIKSDVDSKNEYFSALQLADTGNIEDFINYIAKNLNRSLQIMIAGANGEEIEEDDDLDKEIALLEQRLCGYGEKIDKVRTIENTSDIFFNTIKKLALEIQKKLLTFEKHYLTTVFVVIIDNESYPLDKLPIMLDDVIRKVKIHINYRSIKIKGLEEYSFYFDLNFDFDELNYSIYQTNKIIDFLFVKNYENLTEQEIKETIDIIVKKHNYKLDSMLNKSKP